MTSSKFFKQAFNLTLTSASIVVLLVVSTRINAQTSSTAMLYEATHPIASTTLINEAVATKSKSIFIPSTESAASFNGGQAALNAYLNARLDYPEIAQEYGVEGTISIRFKVMTDGSLAHFSIKESLSEQCDEKVLAVLQAMPNWIPAQQGAHTVAMWCEVPVKFILQ